ncbi:MAG: energy-coupling factor transporter transmembrane protein EcfT [Propionibacteriaceae bacterium]|nr:energy-coupling factor transporter transmembrane protein EcfT [Propionibacteriaceae bacterium]
MRLERLDVRIKIATFVAIMIALFMITHPLGNLVLLALLLAALLASRTPLKGLWTMLQPLLLVFVLIVAVTMVASNQFTLAENAQVLFSLWGMQATLGGLLVGLNFVVRILLMVVATYAFTISTPIDDLLIVMSQVRAPYWLSILVTTAISFIPTMAHKKDLIVEAQRARGARVRDKGPVGQIVSFVPIMVPLITNSILLAENLAIAMTNRGYGATNSMTAMRDLKFRGYDVLVLTVVTAVLLTVIWLRYGLGYGVV